MSIPIASFQRLATPWRCAVERRAQLRDQIGQRIGEIFVFAAAKAVAAHDDTAAEVGVVGIERGDGAALLRREQALQDGGAVGVELAGDLRPVEGIDMGGSIR
ncbi:hypothetical protein ACVWZK_007204 [Bradyrhizobium sp. GM0.4]